jgi:hypothetical protein
MKVLSIRQPWSWAIIHAGKDIENRTWHTNFRGEFLIHAGKGCLSREYDDACEFIERVCDISVPSLGSLPRGGIVGKATLTDCVDHSDSLWFEGDYGLVLANAIEIPFVECKGKNLRFFECPVEIKL